MKKLLWALLSVTLVLMIGTHAEALSYSFVFEGLAEGGTGSATMNIEIVDNVLISVVENTSPLTVDESDDPNAPGITAFGFNVVESAPALASWTLTAQERDVDAPSGFNEVVIGASDVNTIGVADGIWEMAEGENINGITVDYNAYNGDDSPQGNVKGALYNPDATLGLADTPNFFTTATLVMTFDELAEGEILDILMSEEAMSPFVRMKNVGEDGEGSIKEPGEETDPPDNPPVPEPSTVFLIGLGLLGILGLSRKIKR